MGTKLATDRGETLYEFWGDAITEQLAADLADSPGPQGIVDLASNEYFAAVDTDLLDARVVSPRFLDEGRDGSFRVIAFWAKKARGAMAGWIVRERIRTYKHLTDFDLDGYRYDPERSTPDEPTFVRSHDRS